MSEKQIVWEKLENSAFVRLAHQIGIIANVRSIYGEPIERDGVTVIPVAKAAYVFGGGGGKKEGEDGSGGGGGVTLTPVGYIEMKNGETRFCPTRDWLIFLPMIAVGTSTIILSIWELKKLLKARK